MERKSVSGDRKKEKELWEAFLKFTDGDVDRALVMARAAISKWNMEAKKGRMPLSNCQLKRLRESLPIFIRHSAFSYIKTCKIRQEEIDKLQLLRIIWDYEGDGISWSESLEVILDLEIFEDYVAACTEYVDCYLRWSLGEEEIESEMNYYDEKRTELYRLLRVDLFMAYSK